MTIRFAKEADVSQIIELCEAHAIYEKADYDPENKSESLGKHLFQSPDILKCIVAEEADELLGYATFMKQFSTWDADFYIYLDCLFLKEKARGRGLGFKMMSRLKEYARAENCKMIEWQTPDFNSNAIRFYRGLGAVSKSKERFFWEL